MARSSGSDRRRKDDQILVRLLSEDGERARKAAADRTLSAAEWVRELIERELGSEIALPRRRTEDPATQRRLAEIAANLGRQTGALIQLAHTVRKSGVDPALHRAAETALLRARDAQAQVLAQLGRMKR